MDDLLVDAVLDGLSRVTAIQFFFFVDLQDASITYVVTGFVEYKDHHFVAYVKQPRGWVKCDDSVVRVVGHDVGTIWPRLVFLQKFRRQYLGHDITEPPAADLLLQIPQLLTRAVQGGVDRPERPVPNVFESHERPKRFVERVRLNRLKRKQTEVGFDEAGGLRKKRLRRTERGRKRKQSRTGRQQGRTGRQEERTGRKQERTGREQERTAREQERTGREQERTGREQETTGREQERTGREQERTGRQQSRNVKDVREARHRQATQFGARTWNNNLSGDREDSSFRDDNPFARFRDAFALRRAKKDEVVRRWEETPNPLPAQPCLLCDAAFEDRAQLLAHIDECHGGLQRYRNAMLHLESLCPHVVVGQEVRHYVTNYATFLRFGAMDWEQSFVSAASVHSEPDALLRRRRGCGFCARSFWSEEMAEVYLSGETCFMQNPEAVWKLLSVDRYHERWPLIPLEDCRTK